MMKILLWIYILIIGIGSVFMCMTNPNVDPLVEKRKQSDINFVMHNIFLNRCVNEFDSSDIHLAEVYRDKWAELALKDVKELYNVKNQNALHVHKFIDCLKIVSDYLAKKFVCVSFVENFGDDDFILPYVEEEYTKCIEDKNKRLKNPLWFERPKIGLRYE